MLKFLLFPLFLLNVFNNLNIIESHKQQLFMEFKFCIYLKLIPIRHPLNNIISF